MAWPCISRVCCLARFWNQFDKSDLSVPLTIQNYSDISDQEVRSVTKQVAPGSFYASSDPRVKGSPRRFAHRAEEDYAPVGRGSFRARRDLESSKPREDYQPFPSVTQYKQDYKPWPIPRKENFPWISNGGSAGSDSPGNAHLLQAGHAGEVRGEREERGNRGQQGLEDSKTSSYRQEYRPWTGAKPAKSARKPPPAQYSSPGTEDTRVSRETSYQAAYSGEVSRSAAPHQGESVIPSAASHIHPTPVPQPLGSSTNPSNLPQGSERAELGGTNRAEEHLVRTKLPPNPSAVFQGGSRVFNI